MTTVQDICALDHMKTVISQMSFMLNMNYLVCLCHYYHSNAKGNRMTTKHIYSKIRKH